MCCINLKTLSLIVGWMHAIYATTAICVAVYFDYYAKRKLANTPQYGKVTLRTLKEILVFLKSKFLEK